MSLSLSNFEPVGFDRPPKTIFVGDDGMICEALDDAPVHDCKGAYLSPGWADLHVHVWYGGTDFSVRAAQAGLPRGVTAMADAGSAGEAAFHGFREYVIDRQAETIKAFINIGSIGLVACNRVPELAVDNAIDATRTLDVIEKNRDVICGVKVRAGNMVVANHGIEPVRVAKQVAETSNLPLMVHIGEAPPALDEIFDLLTPGDVVTHCFHGKPGSAITQTPAIFERAKHLAERGILMDVGHGAASFDFQVAREAVQDGLAPFSISTDLHEHNLHGPVFDLATTVSKLHALGLPFEACVAAISRNPRAVLGLDSSTNIGARADLTVFDVVPANETVEDSTGNQLELDQVFEPRHAILGDQVHQAARALAEGKDS